MLNPIRSLDSLIILLVEIESTTEIDQFIVNGVFNSESEDFYNDATDNLQVKVNETIFLLETLILTTTGKSDTNVINKLNSLGYTVEIIPDAVYYDENNVDSHRGSIKTSKCLITF